MRKFKILITPQKESTYIEFIVTIAAQDENNAVYETKKVITPSEHFNFKIIESNCLTC